MSIIIRQSQLDDLQGGDISYDKIPLTEDTLVIDLSPEDAFFSVDIYKAMYIQNIGFEEIVDMSIVVVGGLGDILEVENTLGSRFTPDYTNIDMIDNSPSGAIIQSSYPSYDATKLTFYDWLYDRYKNNVPPYHPSWQELEAMEAVYPDMETLLSRSEFENFKEWFRRNIIAPSPMRKSMFSQIDTGLYVPTERNLPPIDDSTEQLPFARRTKLFPYLDAYNRDDPRNVGTYWGFYLKIAADFIPDWELGIDLTSLVINWTGLKDGIRTEHQQIFNIIVNGDMGNMVDFNNLSMENLYYNYPPYFKYYEDQ